jgi:O-antigen/teichoic acid export membrane protein
MLLADLKLRDIQATDVKHEYEFCDYLALRIITILLSLIIISFLAWWIRYDSEKVIIILIIALAKSFDSLSDILYGFLQKHEQMSQISISRIIQGTIQLCALGLVLISTNSLIWGLVSLAISSGIVTFAVDIRNVYRVQTVLFTKKNIVSSKEILRSLYPRLNNSVLLIKLFIIALPLGLAVMLSSLWTNIPRYLIEHFLGVYELGIFAAIAALLTVGNTIIAALGQTVSPRLAKYHASGEVKAFDSLMIKLIAIGIFIGISGFITAIYGGDHLLKLLYRPEYVAYKNVLIWLMAASVVQFTYVFLGTGLQAMRNFHIHLPIQIGTCIVVLVLSYLLISEHGLTGAAWAIFGANLFACTAFSYMFSSLRKKNKQVAT